MDWKHHTQQQARQVGETAAGVWFGPKLQAVAAEEDLTLNQWPACQATASGISN
jgi:hypothetical protein